jgi:hypothetical protein
VVAWALQWVQDIHRFEDAIALIPKVAVQELDGLKRKDPCSEGTAKHQLQHATYKMQQILNNMRLAGGDGKAAHQARVALRWLKDISSAAPKWLQFQQVPHHRRHVTPAIQRALHSADMPDATQNAATHQRELLMSSYRRRITRRSVRRIHLAQTKSATMP